MRKRLPRKRRRKKHVPKGTEVGVAKRLIRGRHGIHMAGVKGVQRPLLLGARGEPPSIHIPAALGHEVKAVHPFLVAHGAWWYRKQSPPVASFSPKANKGKGVTIRPPRRTLISPCTRRARGRTASRSTLLWKRRRVHNNFEARHPCELATQPPA